MALPMLLGLLEPLRLPTAVTVVTAPVAIPPMLAVPTVALAVLILAVAVAAVTIPVPRSKLLAQTPASVPAIPTFRTATLSPAAASPTPVRAVTSAATTAAATALRPPCVTAVAAVHRPRASTATALPPRHGGSHSLAAKTTDFPSARLTDHVEPRSGSLPLPATGHREAPRSGRRSGCYGSLSDHPNGRRAHSPTSSWRRPRAGHPSVKHSWPCWSPWCWCFPCPVS